MKAPVALCCSLFIGANAFADANYYMAKQQANRVTTQNTAEQQRIQNAAGGPAAAAPAAPAPAPSAPPMDPMLQATLGNINNLQGDFAAFIGATGDKTDPAQKASLMNDLSQAAQSRKAPADAVKKLATDLSLAVSGRNKLAVGPQKKLAVDVHALFNSSHLTEAQRKAMLDDVQKILTDGGASLDDATNVVTDLKQIAEATK